MFELGRTVLRRRDNARCGVPRSERVADPALHRGVGGPAREPVEPDQRRAGDRRLDEPDEARARDRPIHAGGEPRMEAGVIGPEDPTGEDDLWLGPDEPGPPGQGGRHRRELVREPIDDRARDGIAPRRRREHGRRQLADPRLVEAARVVRMRDGVRSG